jgi:hypothetical protein
MVAKEVDGCYRKLMIAMEVICCYGKSIVKILVTGWYERNLCEKLHKFRSVKMKKKN